MPERYLSTPEVARMLGVGRMTIWRWCKDGTLPASNISKTTRPLYRIAESAVHAYLEATRVTVAAAS